MTVVFVLRRRSTCDGTGGFPLTALHGRLDAVPVESTSRSSAPIRDRAACASHSAQTRPGYRPDARTTLWGRQAQRGGYSTFVAGGVPSSTPPGPAEKSSGDTAGTWPMPGLVKSQTPSGNAACKRANCASVRLPAG